MICARARRWSGPLIVVLLTTSCTIHLGSSSPPSTGATVIGSGTATASPGVAPPGSATATPGMRTSQTLTPALLALSDMPAGFAIEAPSGPEDTLHVASVAGSTCDDFVALANAAHSAGTLADASISFSGGQDGPFIDESIEAVGTQSGVLMVLDAWRKAVTACPRVTVSFPDAKQPSAATVREVSPPAHGSHPVAFRIRATGGDLDGFEVTTVLAGVADTVVTLDFYDVPPSFIDGASGAAVDKATSVLGPASTT